MLGCTITSAYSINHEQVLKFKKVTKGQCRVCLRFECGEHHCRSHEAIKAVHEWLWHLQSNLLASYQKFKKVTNVNTILMARCDVHQAILQRQFDLELV